MAGHMTQDGYDPAAHYDRVTEAWGLLLGEELHYGVFHTGDESLEVATAALTDRMIQAADLSAGQRVLDVGCGSGAPACRLAEEHAVEVLGITNSQVGVDAASTRAKQRGIPSVSFELRDGTANGLPDESFDRVWVLESSHLMPDRLALISECARVLKPGGKVVLCDIIRHREIPFSELRSRQADFAVLRAAFGSARMDLFSNYTAHFREVGLILDELVDLTAETLPTFDRWRAKATEHQAATTAILGDESVQSFKKSLGILEEFWRDGTLGYGMLSASKPA